MKKALSLLLVIAATHAAAATFNPGPSMSLARDSHTATTLLDGRVFIAGGNPNDATCEIYDPATNTFRRTASMSHPRSAHTATLLNDGRVLIAGGSVSASATDLPAGTEIDYKAEIFDPRTETFSPAPNMLHARYAHSAVRLIDGRVLLTGGGETYNTGFSISKRPQAHAEIFDPAANTFTAAPDMTTPRWNHTSSLLPDGTVLVVGYVYSAGPTAPSAEIYDAEARSVRAVTSLTRRQLHSATTLADGRILLAGGNSESDTPRVDAETYQGSTGFVTPATGGSTTSSRHAAALLSSGRVLFAGWSRTAMASREAMLYDPATNQINATASMIESRVGMQANALANGKVLVTGGGTATTEIYDPGPGGSSATTKRRIVGR